MKIPAILKVQVTFRTLLRATLLAPLLLATTVDLVHADDAEDAWKALIMKALYAAGSNDFAKAEQIFLGALHEAERFGSNDPRVGTTLNSLGLVYKSEKKTGEAMAAFTRAETILAMAYGANTIDVANVRYNIATVLIDQGKAEAAIPNLQQALITYQAQFGGESLKTASVLCMIGDAYRSAHAWKDAEAPLKHCAKIREIDGGMLNAGLGEALNSLAIVYQQQGKYVLADQEYKLAEKIRERTLGIMNPAFADTLEAHAALLKAMGRDLEAGKDSTLAAAIRRNQLKK